MERAQGPILAAGSDATRAREQAAADGGPPTTVRTAEAIARIAGRELASERARNVGGEVVHYATGAAFGALFGVLAPRVTAPGVLAGAAFGALIWLFFDEGVVPLLGFAKPPTAYPASLHAKALASHLVFGAATDASFRAIDRALH
jgi:uncharacterized membrane protein YagU involved in acid resistance